MASIGRPSSFTQEIADKICSQLSDGKSLLSVCKQKGMPTPGTVCRWLADFPAFQQQYARAREMQCEVLAAEIIEISDKSRKGAKVEVKEVARACSVCGKDVRWLHGAWRHSIEDTALCDGAKAEKVTETKTVTADMVDRARLQVDARKWYLSKVLPKKYGDRLELAGDKDAPLVVSIAETLRRRRQAREQQPSPEQPA